MAVHREPVRLVCDGRGEIVAESVSAMRERLRAASKVLTMALELPAATWEPHDWRDFD